MENSGHGPCLVCWGVGGRGIDEGGFSLILSQSFAHSRAIFRVAPVQFGSVTICVWNGLSDSDFFGRVCSVIKCAQFSKKVRF